MCQSLDSSEVRESKKSQYFFQPINAMKPPYSGHPRQQRSVCYRGISPKKGCLLEREVSPSESCPLD